MQMKNMYYKNIALDDVDVLIMLLKKQVFSLENEDEKTVL